MFKKLPKIKYLIGIIVIILIIFSALQISTSRNKVQAYDTLLAEGKNYMQSENYDKAIISFAKYLEYKKDSKVESLMKEAKIAKVDKESYLDGMILLKNKQYNKALFKFNIIKEDSIYYSKCQEQLNICKKDLLSLVNNEIKTNNFDNATEYLNILLYFYDNDSEVNKTKALLDSKKAESKALASKTSNNTHNIKKSEPHTTESKPNNAIPAPTKTVKSTESNTKKLTGYISKVYEQSGKNYLTLDSAEFFRGKIAYEEARKDNYKFPISEGKAFLPDGYYIRNSSNEMKNYPISSNASFKLYKSSLYLKGTRDLTSISYSTLKTCINKEQHYLFHIAIKNGEVIDISEQFIP